MYKLFKKCLGIFLHILRILSKILEKQFFIFRDSRDLRIRLKKVLYCCGDFGLLRG